MVIVFYVMRVVSAN